MNRKNNYAHTYIMCPRYIFQWICLMDPNLYVIFRHQLEKFSRILLKLLCRSNIVKQTRPHNFVILRA